MAKIYTETITLKFSRLVRDNEQSASVFTEQLVTDLENAASALAGEGVIVEVDNITSEE
jgi:hypothetical protein